MWMSRNQEQIARFASASSNARSHKSPCPPERSDHPLMNKQLFLILNQFQVQVRIDTRGDERQTRKACESPKKLRLLSLVGSEFR